MYTVDLSIFAQISVHGLDCTDIRLVPFKRLLAVMHDEKVTLPDGVAWPQRTFLHTLLQSQLIHLFATIKEAIVDFTVHLRFQMIT
jgi:hypothetical protein